MIHIVHDQLRESHLVSVAYQHMHLLYVRLLCRKGPIPPWPSLVMSCRVLFTPSSVLWAESFLCICNMRLFLIK